MHMQRTTIWLNANHTRQLAALGKPTGQRPAQLIRVAIAQFLSRERRKQVEQLVVPVRKHKSTVPGDPSQFE
jgi:hypothetical protein